MDYARRARAILGALFLFLSLTAFVVGLLGSLVPSIESISIGVLSFIFGCFLLSNRFSQGHEEARRSQFMHDLLHRAVEEGQSAVDRAEAINKITGVPGFFYSLGITGMPLATITVTVLFCILAIGSYAINAGGRAWLHNPAVEKDIIPTEFPAAILELSKLLLGAFIGSFVANKSGKG